MKPTPSDPDPSTPPADLVAERAEELTSEEQHAGVDDPQALAEAVLADSERRTFDRAGTADEHRRSEDTVEPAP
ncbi:MAG TPA: hypothetical protein VHL53_22185 [Acidimicrobiia bacterium]|nr:hypothetical protein [Acidimicrobiia bacterium]